MRRVKLLFKSASCVVGNDKVGLLLLVDKREERQVSIPCDKSMLKEISLRVKKVPVTKRMLPETMWQMLQFVAADSYEIIIYGIVDGQYQCMLTNRATLDTVALRASDAVLLALVADIDIYMEQNLFFRQSLPYDEQSPGVSLPVNAITTQMLHEALEKAVEDENYELASQIRDEINKRQNN